MWNGKMEMKVGGSGDENGKTEMKVGMERKVVEVEVERGTIF